MLHFFRQIRQRLLSENKMGKYLKYAVGEIVLVVLGILIALRINNWNEDRKSEKLEIQYLYGMINDLERDSLFFTKKIEAYNAIIKNNTEYLKAAYLDQKSYEEYVEVTGLINLDSENFVSQNATYMELMNSGHLNIFKNKKLKLAIIAHYREYQQVQNHLAEFNEYSTKVLSRFPLGQASFYNAFKPPDSVLRNREHWGWINEMKSERFIFTIDIASLYATKHSTFIGYYKDLVSRCHLLKTAMNNELKLRES